MTGDNETLRLDLAASLAMAKARRVLADVHRDMWRDTPASLRNTRLATELEARADGIAAELAQRAIAAAKKKPGAMPG